MAAAKLRAPPQQLDDARKNTLSITNANNTTHFCLTFNESLVTTEFWQNIKLQLIIYAYAQSVVSLHTGGYLL